MIFSKNRKDGNYIKEKDPMHAIMPYLFDKRTESEVYIKETLDITKVMKWIEKQNKKLDYKMTFFHVFNAVLVKTVYNRPHLNRFIQGHRIYERNKITTSFVAKNKMVDNAKDMMVVMEAKNDENAIELSKRMAVDIFKTKKEGSNDLNNFINKFLLLPRWVLRIVVRIFKWLDYHGWLPESFTKTDSNHATILLSNLGSIKCDSCYHHLNNFGTNSIMITIGTIKEVDGKYFVDISATLDERVAPGFYFAKSLKLVQYILDNPKLLEDRLDEKINFEF